MDRAENIRRLKEQAKLPKAKKGYSIPKKSAKKLAQEKEERELQKQAKDLEDNNKGVDLASWFEDRRKEMTGRCLHCGGISCKDNDKYFKFSIAHILPKRLFASVATHPLNWVELCFWSNSCHTNFDNNILDITQLNCFDAVIARVAAMYPDIDRKERKYIPDVLLQYIEVEK